MTTFFNFNRFFGNNSHASNSKNKRKRTLRIEELESRDLLSVSPFGNDYDEMVGYRPPSGNDGDSRLEVEYVSVNAGVEYHAQAASAPILAQADESTNFSSEQREIIDNLIANNGLKEDQVTWDKDADDTRPDPPSYVRAINSSTLTGNVNLGESLSTLTTLNVAGSALQSLTVSNYALNSVNISNCAALETAVIGGSLATLELSGCTALKSFSISAHYGSLTSLDVSGCTKLESLDFYGPLESLNASGCTALKDFYVAYANNLTTLNLSGCTALPTLSFTSLSTLPALTTLNLSGCTGLKDLFINNATSLETLDLSTLKALENLSIQGSYNYVSDTTITIPLTSLDVTGLTALKEVSVHWTALTSLNAAGCTAMKQLTCKNNDSLETLTLTGCSALQKLSCPDNQITQLDLTGLTALYGIDVSNNKLTTLDVSGLTKLYELEVQKNQLSSLYLSGCAELVILDCSNNQLAELNLTGLTQLNIFDCSDNQLTELVFTSGASLSDFDCSNNQLTSLNLSNCGALGYGFSFGGNQITTMRIDFNQGFNYWDPADFATNPGLKTIDMTIAPGGEGNGIDLSWLPFGIRPNNCTYQWYSVAGGVSTLFAGKDYTEIRNGMFRFSLNPGTEIYCEVVSNKLPGITIKTTSLTVGTQLATPTLTITVKSATTALLEWTPTAELMGQYGSYRIEYTTKSPFPTFSSANPVNVFWDVVSNYDIVNNNGTASYLFDANEFMGGTGSVSMGTTMYFRVIAIGDGTFYTDSSYSNIVNAKTGDAPPLPSLPTRPGDFGSVATATPTNVKVAQTGNSDAIVSWAPTPNAAGYEIEYKEGTSGEWIKVTTTSGVKATAAALEALTKGHTTNLALTGLAENTEYQFRVIALGKEGSEKSAGSLATDSLELATLPTQPITGTFRVAALKGSAASHNSVTLELNTHTSQALQNVHYYVIKCTSHPSLGTFYVAATEGKQAFTITGLQAKQSYKFEIQVVGANGNYLASNKLAKVTAKTTSTVALNALKKIQRTAGLQSVTLDLSKTTAQKGATIMIEVWQTGGNKNDPDKGYWKTIIVTLGDSRAVTIDGLKGDGMKYQFRVAVVQENGDISAFAQINAATVKLNKKQQFPAVKGVKVEYKAGENASVKQVTISCLPPLAEATHYEIGSWKNSGTWVPIQQWELSNMGLSGIKVDDLTLDIRNGNEPFVIQLPVNFKANLAIRAVVKNGEGYVLVASAAARVKVDVKA